MKDIEMIQKLSVLHCIYQMIASADGNIDAERDHAAIDFALSELQLPSVYSWDSSLGLNSYDCFIHISTLSDDNKKSFKTLLHTIAGMGGNKPVRINCADSIFQLCKI
jgi:hypothetical protein